MALPEWKDRRIERENTYKVLNNKDGTITLIPVTGEIYEPGTPLNAINLNKINASLADIESTKFDKNGGELLGEVLNKHKYYMLGNKGGRGFITKNNASGRNELLIYADEGAYLDDSRGSGIHLYGNNDVKHPGGIAFLVGKNDKGTIKVMIDQEGKMVVGNEIITFTDEHKNYGQLTIKNPKDRPALYILEASNSEGDIAVAKGEHLNFGEYDDENGIFNEWLRVESEKCFYKNDQIPVFNQNIQCGKVSINPVANELTTITVKFDNPFATVPIVTATAVSSVVGKILTGCGVSNITKESFDVTILRTNTTPTNINWIAINN